MTKLIITLILTVTFLSCGKAPKDKEQGPPEEESISDGIYSAILIPVNAKVSNEVGGEVKFSRYGDEFKVSVNLFHAPSGTHEQHLHLGISCPQLSDDLNVDGYIDFDEARPKIDYIIVPLDNDLSSQQGGGRFPTGSYKYSQSTSYQLMLSDLQRPDDMINDFFAKLNGDELRLEKRVVMIYSRGRNLPATVSSPLVPLACGILTKISDVPEEDDSWESPPVPRPRGDNYRRRPPRPPAPPPDTTEPDDPPSGGWWDNWRDRWNRWRERMRDWWNGEGE